MSHSPHISRSSLSVHSVDSIQGDNESNHVPKKSKSRYLQTPAVMKAASQKSQDSTRIFSESITSCHPPLSPTHSEKSVNKELIFQISDENGLILNRVEPPITPSGSTGSNSIRSLLLSRIPQRKESFTDETEITQPITLVLEPRAENNVVHREVRIEESRLSCSSRTQASPSISPRTRRKRSPSLRSKETRISYCEIS